MFKLLLEIVNDLAPEFQVIMTGHVNIVESWFQDAVMEHWRRGNKLIPSSWYEDTVGG